MRRRWFVWLVLVSYGGTALGAPLSPDIGLFRLGLAQGEDSRRALGILEARFHRWLENQGAGVSVQRVGLSVNPELLAQERSRAALIKEVQTFESGTSGRKGTLLSRLTLRREQVKDPASAGRWVSRALAWESVAAYQSGHLDSSRQLWNQALALTPDGEFSESPWADGAPAGWKSMADKQLSGMRRDCLVQLPTGGSLETVNGFLQHGANEIALPSGKDFSLQWWDSRRIKRESAVHCRGAGRVAVSEFAAESSLGGLGDRYRVGTLAFIEPGGDGFRLFLYTRGVGLDEIPLEKKLSVRDVLTEPMATQLPVDQAGFGKLRESHGWGNSLRLAGPWMGGAESSVAAEKETPRWYNRWTTWAVAGGIVTGILVAVLAHKPQSQVQTQAHGGLKFPID